MVILRSLSLDRVRVAIMAGTEHPKPISIGTKLRPERPIFLRSLSITKATRAMYPVSSKIERKKNRVTITGRKVMTLPTPLQIPSTTRECTTGLIPKSVSPLSMTEISASTPSSIKSDSHAPIREKVIAKIKAMIPKKHGIAVNRPVRSLSISILLRCSLLSCGLVTVTLHRFSIN